MGTFALLATTLSGSSYALAQTERGEAVRAVEEAISGMESREGAYATHLPEQLLSLGLVLQQEGRHSEAVAVFKRGSHLTRINDGLNSTAQIPYIEGEIISHLALGELDEADRGQSRLFRVQQHGSDGIDLVRALLQQAQWQHRAYDLAIENKEASFGRLVHMADYYLLAFVNIRERDGDSSPQLLTPLHGMLQAAYLISGYPIKIDPHNAGVSANPSDRRMYNRFNGYYAQGYQRGRAIISQIQKVEAARYGEKSLPLSQTLVMLGDWMLWNDKRESADEAYLQAIGELAELDDAQVQIEKFFGAPTALPDLDGVRPLPAEVSAEDGGILLEFGVTRRGKVVDLVRLYETQNADDAISESQANRLIRTLRKTKFRPRFAEGAAATTENIVKAYDIAN